jgi:hypothetical protein
MAWDPAGGTGTEVSFRKVEIRAADATGTDGKQDFIRPG